MFIIHGKEDKVINYNESIKLYEKCKKDIKKELKIVNVLEYIFGENLIEDVIAPSIIEFVDKYYPLSKPINKEKVNNEIKEYSK